MSTQMQAALRSVELSDIERLEMKRRTLQLRLEDGDRRINEAELTGVDVAAWETFWFDLLEEYESICDDLREAA